MAINHLDTWKNKVGTYFTKRFDKLVERAKKGVVLALVRLKCIDCNAGDINRVKHCDIYTCPLWPLRTGKNTLRAKKKRKLEEPTDD